MRSAILFAAACDVVLLVYIGCANVASALPAPAGPPDLSVASSVDVGP